MTRISSAVDSFFPIVVPGKENSMVFEEMLEIVSLRHSVVEHLKRIGKTAVNNFWWNDFKLIKLFNDLYKAGIIPMPIDPVDRIRWISLICLECANDSDFDCSETVIPLDFLPLEFFSVMENDYPWRVIVETIKLREKLAQVGWEAIYSW